MRSRSAADWHRLTMIWLNLHFFVPESPLATSSSAAKFLGVATMRQPCPLWVACATAARDSKWRMRSMSRRLCWPARLDSHRVAQFCSFKIRKNWLIIFLGGSFSDFQWLSVKAGPNSKMSAPAVHHKTWIRHGKQWMVDSHDDWYNVKGPHWEVVSLSSYNML